MWHPNYQNKKLNLCMLDSFKGFIYASNKSSCGALIINIGKKTQFVHATASKQKHPLEKSNKNTKHVLAI